MQRGLEYDPILRAKIDAELIRIGLMSPADAAAAALAAVEKAEAAVGEAEDAEREAVEAERAAEEANAFAEELKKKLRKKKARAGKNIILSNAFHGPILLFVPKLSLLKISVVLHYHLSRYDRIIFFKSTLISYRLF